MVEVDGLGDQASSLAPSRTPPCARPDPSFRCRNGPRRRSKRGLDAAVEHALHWKKSSRSRARHGVGVTDGALRLGELFFDVLHVLVSDAAVVADPDVLVAGFERDIAELARRQPEKIALDAR